MSTDGHHHALSETLSSTILARQPSAKRPANADLYQHISTAKIIELFNQGLSHRKIGKVLGMGPGSVGTRLRREGKVRTRPGLVGKELEEARLDAAWEARHGLANRVICRECGQFMQGMNANGEHSHLRKHHMTADEYASKYPGARFCSIARAAALAAKQGREGDIQKFMEALAAQYLTAKELLECRTDPAWEERRGFDFVACRKCGFKSKTDLYLHVHRHGYSRIKEYRAEYPKAPRVSFARRRDFLSDYTKRMYANKKAHLAELERIAAKREKLAEAECRVTKLREELAKLSAKLGRPRTREDDVAKYGPRIRELRTQGKSWGQVQRIMNQETAENRSLSHWRMLAKYLVTTTA
jgi:hypothetical protein